MRNISLRLGSSLVAVALALLVACSSDSDTPDVVFEGTDGPALFQQACASCHGTDLTGTDRGPSFLDQIYAPGHHSDAAFFLAAKTGARRHHWNFGSMPAVSGLDDAQLEAIIGFVRSEQRSAGIE